MSLLCHYHAIPCHAIPAYLGPLALGAASTASTAAAAAAAAYLPWKLDYQPRHRFGERSALAA